MFKKINFYIIKKFLITFSLVMISVSLLIAMINIFELLDRVSGKQVSLTQIFLLDILPVIGLVEEISVFLITLSSMITLFSLSIRSEITIMRSAGMSLWQILSPIAFGAFVLGLLFILLLNPISILSSKKMSDMERQLINKDEPNLLAPESGIWLKQENVLNDKESIIIRADKIYRKNLQMVNVNLWLFDENNKFYKKIDAKTMSLKDGYWILEKAFISEENQSRTAGVLEIKTHLKPEFVAKKILNNFENVHLFSIYDLPNLIRDLQGSGFSPRKFLVYYYSLLSKPFLFMAMSIMSAFFAINNIRGKYNIVMFVFGIAAALVLYISLIIINALGSSGLLPIFLSTWLVAMILMAISMLLIFKKEAN